jgi:hypothetical protein
MEFELSKAERRETSLVSKALESVKTSQVIHPVLTMLEKREIELVCEDM